MVVMMATAMANNKRRWTHGCIQKGLDALILRPVSCALSHLPSSVSESLAHRTRRKPLTPSRSHISQPCLAIHPSTHPLTHTIPYHTRYTLTYIAQTIPTTVAPPCTYYYCCYYLLRPCIPGLLSGQTVLLASHHIAYTTWYCMA